MIDEYILLLEKSLGLETPIHRESEGVWSLPVGNDVTVTILALETGYSFHSAIAEVPETTSEPLLEKVLLANLFFQGSEGAVLALSEEGKTLTASLDYPYDAEYVKFEEDLEDFLNAVDYWREEVNNTNEAAKSALL